MAYKAGVNLISLAGTIPSIFVVISQRNEMGGVCSPKSRNLAIAQPKN